MTPAWLRPWETRLNAWWAWVKQTGRVFDRHPFDWCGHALYVLAWAAGFSFVHAAALGAILAAWYYALRELEDVLLGVWASPWWDRAMDAAAPAAAAIVVVLLA